MTTVGCPREIKIQENRVALTPALDVGALTNSALADRIVIDEIYVSVAEIRLLGGNPQIPAGGLRLASGGQVLSNDQAGFGHFPFPSSFLSDDLAVFVRIGRSTELRGASVVVKARLYEDAPVAHKLSLTADDDEAPNPD